MDMNYYKMNAISKEEAIKLKNLFLKPRSFNVNHSNYSIQEKRQRFIVRKCDGSQQLKLPTIQPRPIREDVTKKCQTIASTRIDDYNLLVRPIYPSEH